jgi:hypothetical protein
VIVEDPIRFGLPPLYVPPSSRTELVDPQQIVNAKTPTLLFTALPVVDRPDLAARSKFLFSELPFAEHPWFRERAVSLARAYNGLPRIVRPDQVWWLSAWEIAPAP